MLSLGRYEYIIYAYFVIEKIEEKIIKNLKLFIEKSEIGWDKS